MVSRNVVTEHLYDSFVSMLTSTVGLGMERRGHAEVNSSQPVQSFPKVADESGVTVGDDVEWKSILAVPMFEEQGHKIFNGRVSMTRDQPDVSPQATSDGRDTIRAIVLGERTNEVDANAVEAAVRHRKGVERAARTVGGGLIALALVIPWNVELLQTATHPGPVIGRAEECVTLLGTKMATVVMCEPEECLSEFWNARYA